MKSTILWDFSGFSRIFDVPDGSFNTGRIEMNDPEGFFKDFNWEFHRQMIGLLIGWRIRIGGGSFWTSQDWRPSPWRHASLNVTQLTAGVVTCQTQRRPLRQLQQTHSTWWQTHQLHIQFRAPPIFNNGNPAVWRQPPWNNLHNSNNAATHLSTNSLNFAINNRPIENVKNELCWGNCGSQTEWINYCIKSIKLCKTNPTADFSSVQVLNFIFQLICWISP